MCESRKEVAFACEVGVDLANLNLPLERLVKKQHRENTMASGRRESLEP